MNNDEINRLNSIMKNGAVKIPKSYEPEPDDRQYCVKYLDPWTQGIVTLYPKDNTRSGALSLFDDLRVRFMYDSVISDKEHNKDRCCPTCGLEAFDFEGMYWPASNGKFYPVYSSPKDISSPSGNGFSWGETHFCEKCLKEFTLEGTSI
jgi:hypothetical protein